MPLLGGAVLLALLPLGVLSNGARFELANLAEILAALAAAVAAWVRSRAGQIPRSWRLMAIAALGWTASQAVWAYFVLGRHKEPPYVYNLGYLLASGCGLVGLVTLPLASVARRWSRLRSMVEGGMIAVTGFLLMWVVLLAPVVAAHRMNTPDLVITAAYPVCDVLLVSLVLFVSRYGASRHVSMSRLGAGLVVIAWANITSVYLRLHGGSDVVPDAGYVVGWLLVAAAALHDRGADAVEQPSPAVDTGLLWQLRPYLIGLVGAAAGLWRLYSGSRPDRVAVATILVMALLVLAHQLPVIQENIALTRHLVQQVDIRDRRVAYQESHDLLTGLANRDLLLARLSEMVPGRFVGLLALRLEELAAVRESLGDGVGDRLVVAASTRLDSELRPGDLLARTGDGEFAVLLDPEIASPSLLRLAERLRAAFHLPLVEDERPLSSTVSVAVVERAAGRSAEDLLRDARVALEQGRDRGTGRVTVFQPLMQAAAVERFRLTRELERAIADKALTVHFQPVVDPRSGAVLAAEALARWPHPERGFVPPDQFVPLAESRGLIIALGSFVLEESLRQAASWASADGRAAPKVTVNVSVHQLRWPELVGSLAALLRRYAVPPSRVVLEITESVLADDVEASLDVLRRLRALGVAIALDDFGTGYSSLSYLQRFPVDTVKIDRSFVTGLDSDGHRRALTRAIVSLCTELGFSTVAEGVETAAELETLALLGCTAVQGYLIARPMEGSALVSWLAARPATGAEVVSALRTA